MEGCKHHLPDKNLDPRNLFILVIQVILVVLRSKFHRILMLDILQIQEKTFSDPIKDTQRSYIVGVKICSIKTDAESI